MSSYVMYLILRRDLSTALKWPFGAVATQAAHAASAVMWMFKDDPNTVEYTKDLDHMHKVLLGVDSEEALLEVKAKLESKNLDHKVWIEDDMPVCIALKPYPKEIAKDAVRNGTCMPPLSGKMTKHQVGYIMEIRSPTGVLSKIYMRPIYHGYSGEQNEEMNMVLYGCNRETSDGGCPIGEELVLIMSNSRHPQTLQLFKSAQVIEDEICIDILHFGSLNTYTACGDGIVDEDQKLIHAQVDENNEFVDVECKEEPRILTVVAYIDTALTNEQIAHISCRYESLESASCEWIRQNECFKTNLKQKINTGMVQIESNFLRINGSEDMIDFSGMVIWDNGDEYISLHCKIADDDGSCADYRVYVWSDEDHMDQPTITEIYRQLQAVCVDPTDLIFLNTFHECNDKPRELSPAIHCGPVDGWSPTTRAMLEGVWYVAADLNDHPKIFLKNAVFDLRAVENTTDMQTVTYFAQKEDDVECIGPRNGSVKLLPNSTMEVTIEYRYTLVPEHRNTLKFKYQVLYLDNQRAALYWCFKRSASGKCLQHDINLLVRSRHFSLNDMTMMMPYLDRVCIQKKQLRWFDLNSRCGMEIAATTKLRRDLITLSHYDVLDILTDVQEPKCTVQGGLTGVRAQLTSLEKGGIWYLLSRFDEMAMDTYAMIGRISTVSENTAVLNLRQSASYPGNSTQCFTRAFTIWERNNGSDYYYELHFESTTKNSTTMIFRFLFYNRHVGVVYSCIVKNGDGTCKERAIYVLSRHESIDNAELTVLDMVAKSVCIEPKLLYHGHVHDGCMDQSQLKTPPCSLIDISNAAAEWEQLTEAQIEALYGKIVYYSVAVSRPDYTPIAIQFDGKQFQKITEELSGCLYSPVSVQFSARNRLLARIQDDVVLLHPAATRDDLLMKEAQLSGTLPCLHPVALRPNTSSCAAAIPPACKSSEPMLGEWMLYASDPSYVLNWKCKIELDGQDYVWDCSSESWIGECDALSTKIRLSVDVWGGFVTTPFDPAAATLYSISELLSHGNVSVSADRLVLFADGDLVGRRYSVWTRLGKDLPAGLRADLAAFCVWPTEPQIRSMVWNC
ncbi:hypothetical protein WR25_18836 [Diploscapter pachys]|uniref:peptidyl-tRNA hydrolase n=1 Tax=Diploscapter pachys TaxID=2018661 RepID=A0A2A2KIB8_9BILA|nr:hypothetical protein WR25_18836 [Diploscapter pachys]